MPFETRVLGCIRARALLDGAQCLLAATSGGADSVALLRTMVALRVELSIEVVCAHVEHGLHSECAAHSEFVRSLAGELGVPSTVRSVDVLGRARTDGLSIEHAARVERYLALEAMAAEVGAERIATGHTATDRAETVLVNLMRGTGPEGLQGVPPRRGRIIRPLIEVSRADVLAYLRSVGARWVEDPTNAQRDALRNRARHELLPLLESVAERSVSATLARLAEAAELEREAVVAAARLLLDRARVRTPGMVLSVPALLAMGAGAATLVLRQAAEEVGAAGVSPNLAQVRQVLELLESRSGQGEQNAAGCRFVRDQRILRVLRLDPDVNGC